MDSTKWTVRMSNSYSGNPVLHSGTYEECRAFVKEYVKRPDVMDVLKEETSNEYWIIPCID